MIRSLNRKSYFKPQRIFEIRLKKVSSCVTALLAAALLTGCYSTRPEISTTKSGYADKIRSLRVAETPVMVGRNMHRNPGSLWQSGNNSFFKDNRARRAGDILTIVINEMASAEVEAGTDSNRTHSGSAGLTNLLNLEGFLQRRALSDSTGNLLNTNSNRTYSGDAKTDREDTLNAKIAAVVTEVLPNGYMVIQGQKEVRVNYELQDMRIEGIVRPQDISAENTVSSDKVAEARISYTGRGMVDEAQEPQPAIRFIDKWLPL